MGPCLSHRRRVCGDSVSVADAVRALDTGDLVFFSGKSVISLGIKCASLSEWSHVGIVICDPRLSIRETYLLEAVIESDEFDNVVTERATSGVRLVNLDSRLGTYNGSALAYRKLSIDPGRRQDIEIRMWEFAMTHGQTDKYDATCGDGCYACCYPFTASCHSGRARHRYQCASLTAKCYSDAGLVTLEHGVEAYLPTHFSETNEQLYFRDDGVSLGRETYVRVNNAPTWGALIV